MLACNLLPHEGGILLIDNVIQADDISLTATTSLEHHRVFLDSQGRIPGYVSMEVMAQTIAAFSGLQRQKQGLAPRVGLLLGARSFDVKRPFLPASATLSTTITLVLMSEGLAVFNCQVSNDDEMMAVAQVKAIQPASDEELEEVMSQE